MRIDLQSHPKVVRILSATKSDKFRVIGGLHAVWSIFDIHSEDGVLVGYTPETMDHVIGWEGFSSALIDVEWLDEITEGLVMPEFEEHNGKSAKRRAEDQKRKRDQRKSEDSPQTVRKKSGQNADTKRTREEKRREENKNNRGDASASSCPDPSLEGAEPFERLPTNRYDTIGETFPVTFELLEQLQQTYLAVNAIQSIKEAKSWLHANKAKRKTLSGMPAFLNRWFKREHDRGGNRSDESLRQQSLAPPSKATRDISLEESLNDRDWALNRFTPEGTKQ